MAVLKCKLIFLEHRGPGIICLWAGLSDSLRLAGIPTPSAVQALGRLPSTRDHVVNFCDLLAVSLRSMSDIVINGPRQLPQVGAAARLVSQLSHSTDEEREAQRGEGANPLGWAKRGWEGASPR